MQQLTLETGSENMGARRETGKSWLADQGHDIAIGDAPCLGSTYKEIATKVQNRELSWSDAATNEGYFLPSSMTTADALHILLNASEDSFGTSALWLPFEPVFRELVVETGKWSLRSRMLATFMKEKPAHERQLFHSVTGDKFG